MKSRISLAHELIQQGVCIALSGDAAQAKVFLDKGNELLRNHEPVTAQELKHIRSMRLISEAKDRWLHWIAR